MIFKTAYNLFYIEILASSTVNGLKLEASVMDEVIILLVGYCDNTTYALDKPHFQNQCYTYKTRLHCSPQWNFHKMHISDITAVKVWCCCEETKHVHLFFCIFLTENCCPTSHCSRDDRSFKHKICNIKAHSINCTLNKCHHYLPRILCW